MSAGLLRVWRRLLRRIGVPGVVGLALLVAAIALAAGTPALRQEARTLREFAAARDAALNEASRAPPQLSAEEQWRRFSAGFPTRERNAEDLKLVFAAARRNGVSLLKGEYRVVAEANSPFVTYALTLPVRESYGGIKKFTADVLRSLPHAEMDELRLERSDAGATTLDARIRISLIYRAS